MYGFNFNNIIFSHKNDIDRVTPEDDWSILILANLRLDAARLIFVGSFLEATRLKQGRPCPKYPLEVGDKNNKDSLHFWKACVFHVLSSRFCFLVFYCVFDTNVKIIVTMLYKSCILK